MLHINLTISPTEGTAATITIEQDTIDWAFKSDVNQYNLYRFIDTLKKILVSIPLTLQKEGDNND